jgi:protein required for attachment to host cells
MSSEVIMSKTIAPDVSVNEDISYENAIKQMFSEMKQANEKMERDQEEIDSLKAETHEILARLR